MNSVINDNTVIRFSSYIAEFPSQLTRINICPNNIFQLNILGPVYAKLPTLSEKNKMKTQVIRVPKSQPEGFLKTLRHF